MQFHHVKIKALHDNTTIISKYFDNAKDAHGLLMSYLGKLWTTALPLCEFPEDDQDLQYQCRQIFGKSIDWTIETADLFPNAVGLVAKEVSVLRVSAHEVGGNSRVIVCRAFSDMNQAYDYLAHFYRGRFSSLLISPGLTSREFVDNCQEHSKKLGIFYSLEFCQLDESLIHHGISIQG